MIVKEKAFYTIKQLQDRWEVSRATIYREFDRGRLKKHLIGGQVRIPAAEVARYEGRG